MPDNQPVERLIMLLNRRVMQLEEQCEHLHGDIAALVGKCDYLERRANTLDALVRDQARERSA